MFSKLQKAKDWLKPWSNAIVDCLYAALADDAERHLNEARAAIESTSELNADDKDVCRLHLHYLEYQIRKALGSRDQLGKAFGEALRAIGEPVAGEAANIKQRILLVQLRSSGMRVGFREFSEVEFHELFDAIPEDERTSELWHTVANWSYHRRDRNTLGQAFEFFTVNADGWLSDYTWQHVNCMYQLVSGKAKRIDVTELLKRVTLTPQMDNFNKHIWPMVIELGLADDDLEQTRQQLTERIERDGKHVPRKEARTKTAIRHL